MVRQVAEKLNVSLLETFIVAAGGDTTRNAYSAYDNWLLHAEMPLWYLNFARKVLYEDRENTLMRTVDED